MDTWKVPMGELLACLPLVETVWEAEQEWLCLLSSLVALGHALLLGSLQFALGEALVLGTSFYSKVLHP